MWYQRNITIPSDWNGKKIFLNFGAVDYCAEIFINGKFVQRHFGGSSSFAVDLTRYVTPGKTHNLVVFVQDDLRSGLRPEENNVVTTIREVAHIPVLPVSGKPYGWRPFQPMD